MANANTDRNFDPNARFDMGPNAAGCGRTGVQATMQSWGTEVSGMGTNAVQGGAEIWSGFSCAGNFKTNVGPNVAGAQRSYNNL